MNYSIVDVFANSKFAGNQLAVVRGASHLDTAQMQKLAQEFNFSETTFVTRETGNRARVRIFTPSSELPFAGHPTLGTAWDLTKGLRPITLELDAGDIPVVFRDGLAWMTPPTTRQLTVITAEEAAMLIGVNTSDIDLSIPPAQLQCGLQFVVIAVNSIAALKRAKKPPTPADGSIDNAPFIVCKGGYSTGADFAARMFFFDGVVMREDPATGSANSAFAAYLKLLGLKGHYTVEQGFEINRPSHIYLDIGVETLIGGRVQLIATGQLVQ